MDFESFAPRPRSAREEDGIFDLEEEPKTVISSKYLNNDQPPRASLSREDLKEQLNKLNIASKRISLPMKSRKNISSIRVIPQSIAKRSLPSSRYIPGKESEKSSADSREVRVYALRQKFERLNAKNKSIPVPDTMNLESLEKMYVEAVKTDHYSSNSPLTMVFIGAAFGLFQRILKHLGYILPDEFVNIQLQAVSLYPHILEKIGEPSFLSATSSLPPFVQLGIVMIIHTIMFFILYKSTGDLDKIRESHRIISGWKFMGGASSPEEPSGNVGIGGFVGNLIGGGSGGISGIINKLFGGNGLQNIVSGMMAATGSEDNVDDVDLDNPPSPVPSPKVKNAEKFNSVQNTPFD